MMLSKNAAEDVLDLNLTGRDFYLPKHEVIFDAIRSLFDRGEPVDTLAVIGELERGGLIGRAGGAEYLLTIIGIVPTAANAGYYAGIVSDKAILRRLVEAGTKIAQMGYATEGDPNELVDNARGAVEDAAAMTAAKVVSMEADAGSILKAHRQSVRMVATPWAEMSSCIGGFAPGRVYTFGARPGAGKSALASQIAYSLAAEGPVIFATMEMDKGEMYARIVSQQAEVYYGAMTQEHMSDFMQAKQDTYLRDKLRDIRVIDDGTQTVASIRAAVRGAQRDGKVAGVIVDYIHLLSTPTKIENETQRINEITRGLKQLAMDMKVPVIALSQLNRNGADGDRPNMQNLRGSGSIEQDSDVIVFLYRDPDEQSYQATVSVYLAKNRQGPNQVGFMLKWEGEFVRAVDL